MSYRYAVLWETGPGHDARPAGLVIEQEDRVLVEARDELGLPRVYKNPFQVLGPDLTTIQYTPADDQYFDQVILDLSRGFVIGKEGCVNSPTEGVILKLLSEYVFRPLRRDHVTVYYDTAGSFPSVKNHRHRYWGGDEVASAPTPSETASSVDVSGRSYVVA